MDTNLKTVILDNDHSLFWFGQKKWAEQKLAEPEVIYQNGRSSYECANEVLDRAEDELIFDYALRVTG